jgi:hypothetical protein
MNAVRIEHGQPPLMIFAFHDETGQWYPGEPEEILPGGPYGSGAWLRIHAGQPSRFAGQKLTFAYEVEPTGRLADDVPPHRWTLREGRDVGNMHATAEVHELIWGTTNPRGTSL